MTWLTVAYLLLVTEVPCPDCGNLPNVQVQSWPTAELQAAADSLDAARERLRQALSVPIDSLCNRGIMDCQGRGRPTREVFTVSLGRPRYTTVPFESLDALEEYIADRHITSGIVLEVKKGKWYRIESTPRIEFIPLKAGQ